MTTPQDRITIAVSALTDKVGADRVAAALEKLAAKDKISLNTLLLLLK